MTGAKTAPQIGDEMPDGTVYAGISPNTGQSMYTTKLDAPIRWNHWQSLRFTKSSVEGNRRDWRIPSKEELNVLFNHRAEIKGFRETGLSPDVEYWSSSSVLGQFEASFMTKRFTDGHESPRFEILEVASLRCVCG